MMILVPVFAFHFFFLSGEGRTDSGPDHLQEAKKLAGLEVDYFQKKIRDDWKGLYGYQHPDFRERVSIEEFQFFDGRVLYNYRDEGAHHVSGGLTAATWPTVSEATLPPVEMLYLLIRGLSAVMLMVSDSAETPCPVAYSGESA